ncbi:uncharacterized protein LOC135962208 isoform X1 [Calliphora vicina]|uniref:uncharacterized protein LOC135962208 isoform X1 n=1 Tax=Calliphora vicina TaxID=7373 RepID=UPI00325B85D2
MENEKMNKNMLINSEQVPMCLTEHVTGSNDPNPKRKNEEMDDTLVLGDSCPESTLVSIPTDVEGALLEPSTSANANTTEQKTENLNDRPKLCGASRKRLKLYMEHGMNIEEARILCLKPMKEVRSVLHDLKIPRKIGRSDESIAEKPNPQKQEASATADGSLQLSDVAEKRMSFLLSNGYSRDEAMVLARKPLDVEKIAEQIRQRSIERESRESRNSSDKFTYCRNITQEGDKLLAFADPKRQSSFKETHTKAKLSKMESQKIELSKELSLILHSKEVVGFFHNSVHDDTDRILFFIQCQNDGLNVDAWKLLRRLNKITNNVMLSLTIDDISAAKLKETRGKIFYKFRQIRLHVKDVVDRAEAKISSTDMWPCKRLLQQALSRRQRRQQ